MCLSFDGKYVFTAGGSVVNMWHVNPNVLAASAKVNGLGVDVFFDMVEGAAASFFRLLFCFAFGLWSTLFAIPCCSRLVSLFFRSDLHRLFAAGGAEGELIADLKEYFYYAQIRRQGLSSMVRREVSDRVPIAEVPDIMRAIGFFPTERQIEVRTRVGCLGKGTGLPGRARPVRRMAAHPVLCPNIFSCL